MLTLFHVPFSRSQRVRWLLEELGLRYELVTRSFADLKAPDHRALHPLGKVPVLRDGNLVLYESGAILQHLLRLLGEATPSLAAYLARCEERPAYQRAVA